jgi:hypothetical protein
MSRETHMAFVKLFPPKGRSALPVAEVIRRWEDEFGIVGADRDEGQDHVASIIAATLRFSDELTGKHERLAWLQPVKDAAVYVSFGESVDLMAGCCVMSDSDMFFGSHDEVNGPARPLVQRAASALGYTMFEG